MKIYIDLLPPEKKKELSKRKIFKIIINQWILFTIPLVVFIAILLSIKYILVTEKNTLYLLASTEQSRGQYAQLTEYEKKFEQVNNASQVLYKLEQGHLHWKKLFENLDEAVPQGVEISNISTKNYQVFILGKARNRETLLLLKDKLEEVDCFEAVNVPLANLVVKNDVDFQIDFVIKDNCLRQIME